MLRSIYAYNIIIILHYPINILEVSVMQSKVLILHDQTPCLFVALNQRSLWIRIETKLQRCENHQLPSSHDRILRSQSELHPQCFDVHVPLNRSISGIEWQTNLTHKFQVEISWIYFCRLETSMVFFTGEWKPPRRWDGSNFLSQFI